jgi:transposase
MFLKLTKSRGHRYAQLVESFRDEQGRSRHRTLTTLGRLDEADGQVDALLHSLLRAKGKALSEPVTASHIVFEPAHSLGDVWALDCLWREVGLDALATIFRRQRYTTEVEHAIRAMVFNRLCNADSKLGVLRWLQSVSLPSTNVKQLTHQQLLRSMDALMDHEQAVDALLAKLLRPMVDQELSLVFYDLTTLRIKGRSELAEDIRHYGLSKEGGIARQVMLGVVQTAEGLPIHHEVFEGNQPEGPTLLPALEKVLERFSHIRRLVIVADRGLLSLDNMQAIKALRLAHGRSLEFILAVPGRRYGEFRSILQAFHEKVTAPDNETIDEMRWQDMRLIVAHHPVRAKEQTTWRRKKIAELEAQATLWVDKLDAQNNGRTSRGRKLSNSGIKARLYHEVKQAHLAHIIKVDMTSNLFTFDLDSKALAQAELHDGKLLLVTNVMDLTPHEVIARYKSLADIERGFKVLKSEIEIAPIYHRLPQRIRAHAQMCFMALILYRIMRQRLKQASTGLSPESALAALRRIQHHRISVSGQDMTGVSTMTQEQVGVLRALRLPKPDITGKQKAM